MPLQCECSSGYTSLFTAPGYPPSLLSGVCSLAGFAALREEGQRPDTMRDAYAALVKAV